MKRRSYSRQLLRAKPLRNALLALVSSWNCPKFTKSYVMHACDVFLKYALEIAGKSTWNTITGLLFPYKNSNIFGRV